MSSSDPGPSQTTAGDGWFKTTHWSVVLAAGADATPQRNDALAKLCQVYWPPIYSYTRKLGHKPEDAEDLTQEVFCRLVEKKYLKRRFQNPVGDDVRSLGFPVELSFATSAPTGF